MAASSGSVGASGSSWSKWQIALVLGAPVAVGLGIWYFKNSSSAARQDKGSATEDGRKNKIASMATSSQTSLDMAGEGSNLPFEPAEEVWLEITFKKWHLCWLY
jgi:import receptor subunit TOM70